MGCANKCCVILTCETLNIYLQTIGKSSPLPRNLTHMEIKLGWYKRKTIKKGDSAGMLFPITQFLKDGSNENQITCSLQAKVQQKN